MSSNSVVTTSKTGENVADNRTVKQLPVLEIDEEDLNSYEYSLRDFDYIPADLVNHRWAVPSLSVDRVRGYYTPCKLPIELTDWGIGPNSKNLYIDGVPVALDVFARITRCELTITRDDGTTALNPRPGVRFESLRDADHTALQELLRKKASVKTDNLRSTFKSSTQSLEWPTSPRKNTWPRQSLAQGTNNTTPIAKAWPWLYDGTERVQPPKYMEKLNQTELKANDIVILCMTVERWAVEDPDEEDREDGKGETKDRKGKGKANRAGGQGSRAPQTWDHWMVRFEMHHITKLWSAPPDAPLHPDDPGKSVDIGDWEDAGPTF